MAYAANKEMLNVSGTVFAVSKTGKQICINDDGDKVWFGVYSAADLKGVGKGDVVEFQYYVSGEYNNISGKTFKITKKVAPPSGSPGAAPQNGPAMPNVGVEIGMSINNAVAIAIAQGKTEINYIKKVALEIYRMSSDMREFVIKEKAEAEAAAAKAASVAEAASEATEEVDTPQAESKAPARAAKKPPADPAPYNDDVPF